MKALLLVGGYATRLRPLSINRPKCLFPLNNKPIINYLLENLANSGCSEVVLAVNNHAEMIKNYLGHMKFGMRLHYSLEDTPLGTGGPIKLAEEKLKEEFLVLNGDILSFIDYNELMRVHISNNTTATITLKEIDDLSRYGVVRFGKDDSIIEFVEKPEKEVAPSNWINAGCYALSQEIFNYIPEGKVSIEREVFPKLASKNQLMGYKYFKDWIDIGVPQDYINANQILHKTENNTIFPRTTIGQGSQIKNSIIWENTCVGKNVEITQSIIANNCNIGDNVIINNAVIADNVIIDDNVKILTGTKIWPYKHIETSITKPNQEIK